MVPSSLCRLGGRLGVPGRSHTPDRKCRPSPKSWAAFPSGFTWASSPSHMPRFSLSPSPTSRLSVPSLESGPGTPPRSVPSLERGRGTPCAHRGASARKGLSLPLPCPARPGGAVLSEGSPPLSPLASLLLSGLGCGRPGRPMLSHISSSRAPENVCSRVLPKAVRASPLCTVPSCCSPPRRAPRLGQLLSPGWVFLVHWRFSAYTVPGVCEARRRLWWVNNGTFRGSGACCRDSRKVAPIKAKSW